MVEVSSRPPLPPEVSLVGYFRVTLVRSIGRVTEGIITHKIMTTTLIPQAIAKSQKIHLQLNEYAMIPPKTGPIAGPPILTALKSPI
jgi:hypothetical protein